jgi:membrane protease YdiL (CAAX protease family)
VGGQTAAEASETRSTAPSVRRPGAAVFTIEGRAAPGLFVLGWLATIMGLGITFVGSQADGTPALVLVLFGLGLMVVGLVAGAGSQALERRAKGVTGYAGPSPFLVFAASIPLAVILGAIVAVGLDVVGLESGTPLASLLFLLVTDASYLVLVGVLVVGTGALSWAEMGLRRIDQDALQATIRALTLAIPILALTILLNIWLATFLPAPDSPLPEPTDRFGQVINLIAGVVVAPVAEEIFFRGFATTAWLRRMSPTAAIVRGALFFSFAHVLTVGGSSFGEAVQRAAFAFVLRLPVALALGWVYVRSRSLAPSIALHASFNGFPLLLELLRS